MLVGLTVSNRKVIFLLQAAELLLGLWCGSQMWVCAAFGWSKIFSTVASVGLCFGFVLETAWVTEECFSYY